MKVQLVQEKIFEIRKHKVMLDFHLAELFDTPTKSLNLAVKRNLDSFPKDFMFQLNKKEWDNLRFQFETSRLKKNVYCYECINKKWPNHNSRCRLHC